MFIINLNLTGNFFFILFFFFLGGGGGCVGVGWGLSGGIDLQKY